MNLKQTFVLLVILIAAAVAFGFWASVAPNPQSQAQYVLNGEQIGEGSLYVYSKEAPGYYVEVEYPRPVPLASRTAATRAQQTLEEGLLEIVTTFETDAAAMLAPEELSRLEEFGRRYELKLSFTEYSSTNTLSYLFSIYQDTGGAHPNGYFHTFVFNEQGEKLSLGGLFVDGSDYVDRLSLLSSIQIIEEMKKRLQQDDVSGAIFAEGLSPSEQNFENFVLDGDTLAMFFPPYQVAAYAAGTFEVRVPLADLADILKPAFR